MGRTVKFSLRLSDKWSAVAPFFDAHPDAYAQVSAYVPERSKTFVFDALTVKGMLEAVAGRTPSELAEKARNSTVREWMETFNALKDGLDDFTAFMEATAAPVTAEQTKMARGTLKGNIEEAVLWTLKNSYTLHGLEDAHALTVYEYKIARKNEYNEAVVAYNQSLAAAAGNRGRRR